MTEFYYMFFERKSHQSPNIIIIFKSGLLACKLTLHYNLSNRHQRPPPPPFQIHFSLKRARRSITIPEGDKQGEKERALNIPHIPHSQLTKPRPPPLSPAARG